ncbi:MAG: hypothetical protein ACREQ9_01170, partial [Candidatus Binatia bacterium]
MQRFRSFRSVSAVVPAVTFLVLFASGARAQTIFDPSLQIETVVTGLSAPTTMAFLGPDEFLVLQKNDGRVRRVVGGTLLATPVLDVAVSNNSERGLLGIAIDDQMSPSGVFLYYT